MQEWRIHLQEQQLCEACNRSARGHDKKSEGSYIRLLPQGSAPTFKQTWADKACRPVHVKAEVSTLSNHEQLSFELDAKVITLDFATVRVFISEGLGTPHRQTRTDTQR